MSFNYSKGIIWACAALLMLAVNAKSTNAAIVHESALLGETGLAPGSFDGSALADFQFLGSRFTIGTTTQVTAIGGHILGFDQGQFGGVSTLFGAIVPLPAANAFPSFSPGELESNAIAATVFTPDPLNVTVDLLTPLSTTLSPGDYALIFGAGLFGAGTIQGAMPDNNTDLPGSSYFFCTPCGVGDSWLEDESTPYPANLRFVVEGTHVSEVPVPAAFPLLLGALTALGFFIRLRGKA